MERQVSDARGKLIGQGRTAEIYAWGDGQALKLYHAGWPASWVEHEAQVSSVVAATGLPVSAVGATLELDGRYGLLFERIAGPSLLQEFSARPWTLARALRAFTDLHLAMHRCVVSGLPSQREQLTRQIQEASPLPEGIREAALARLERLPDGDALCHGDYHPDNVLMTRRGPVIIDWGSASSGHPLADVARTELLLQMGELPSPQSVGWLLASARVFVRCAYVRRYLRLRPASADELAAWRFPIAVARLGEGITGERDKLLRLIEAARP
ncbi:MAG TPA: phosphotransferase [Ktedonobacterales bacterium]|jgi:serine/threonine protein kinase